MWTTATFDITFNLNDISASSDPTSTVSTKEVTYGEEYGELPTPVMTGYTFEGWFTAASEEKC